MRSLLLSALAVATLAATAPSASASATATVDGGCFLVTVESELITNGAFVGLLGDLSLTRSRASGQPIGATVTCVLQVNGSTVDSVSVPGSGVQAGAKQTAFVAAEGDAVAICQQVSYADGSSDPSTCRPASSAQLPPQEIRSTVDPVLAPLLCPVLAALHGTYGPVTVTTTGDVVVLGTPIVDCPPAADGSHGLLNVDVRVIWELPPPLG